MLKKIVMTVLTGLGVLCVAGSSGVAKAPQGWKLKGNAPKSYETGLDSSVKHSGKSSGYLRAKATWKTGFGTLMQVIRSDNYKGKRVRLSAWVKTKNIVWWSGLWMRVDGKKRKILAFDNMQRRPIRGTTSWTKYSVVLDVAPQSTGIAFGILLAGKGQVWLDDLKFEIVGSDVPTTDQLSPKLPKTPQNIGFEKK